MATRKKWILVCFLAIVSLLLYYLIAYKIERWQTGYLLGSYTLLFSLFLGLVLLLKGQIKLVFGIAIVLRLFFLFSTPSLSDDIYRFIWDASLLTEGVSPYKYTPRDFVENFPHQVKQQEIYRLLSDNTARNYSNYPPVAQYTTSFAYLISAGDIHGTIVILRCLMILVEIGIMILIWWLLPDYDIPADVLSLYALNPLVILEMTGNLHHEAYMVLFSLLFAYLFSVKKWTSCAASMSLAIASKLLPLMFLPLLIRRLWGRRLFTLFALIALGLLLLFLPFIDGNFIEGMKSSTMLYFNKFEFNASIYYLVREIGFYKYGYNLIQTVGPRMAVITFCMLLVFYRYEALKKMSLLEAFMWVLLIYLAMTSIFHPWYLVPLFAFSIFTNYRFALIWTFLIFFTYAGYGQYSFSENYLVIILEYGIVYGYLIYELFRKNRATQSA